MNEKKKVFESGRWRICKEYPFEQSVYFRVYKQFTDDFKNEYWDQNCCIFNDDPKYELFLEMFKE